VTERAEDYMYAPIVQRWTVQGWRVRVR
jgi:hypothetical protein